MNSREWGNADKFVRTVITKKTKVSLKISFAIFLSFLVLFSTILITSFGQYSSIQKCYYDNLNANVIEVSSKSGDRFVENLNYKDMDSIKGLIGEDVDVWSKHMIRYGITDIEDNSYFIYSFSKGLYDEIGLTYSEANICYSSNPELDGKDIQLRVPVIDVVANGLSSSKAVDMILHCKYIPEVELSFVNSALVNVPIGISVNLLVGEDTYYEIAKCMSGLDYEELVDAVNEGSGFGTSPVDDIYVHCNNLADVDEAANIIIANNYNTNYALSYFDNLNGELMLVVMSIGIVVAILLLITATTLILSYELYFKNIQKDLGILKHYGYSDRNIFRIYKGNILKSFIMVVISIATYNFILSAVFIKYMFLEHFVILCGIEIAFLSFVFAIISILLLKKCKKPTIELLKFSKEFE
jgi:hypothetical protein